MAILFKGTFDAGKKGGAAQQQQHRHAKKQWCFGPGEPGERQDHRGYVARKGLAEFPYLVSELLGKTYGVSKLPYAVLIDEAGRIASMGIINSREHLDSLFEAKERKIASIQDYMGRRDGVHYVEADKA